MSSPNVETRHAKEKVHKKKKSPKTAQPMLNHDKSTEEQNHLPKEPERNGPSSATALTPERAISSKSAPSDVAVGVEAKRATERGAKAQAKLVAKDVVHDAVKSGISPTTSKNSPVRPEPEMVPPPRSFHSYAEERSLSSTAMCPPGPYENVPQADLVFRRRSVMLIVAASAVGCIIMTLVFSKLLHTVHEIDLACHSNECRKIAEYMNSVVDASVRPCDDFYRHVCGRWLRSDATPSSFAVDAARNFSEIRHVALSRGRDGGVAERRASLFYRSCLAFFGHAVDLAAVADSLFKELNVPAAAWLKETSPEGFFADVVRLSFVHGFHSLFDITSWKEGNETRYAIDEQPSFAQMLGEHGVGNAEMRRYLNVLLDAVFTEGNVSETTFEEVVSLDSRRSRNQHNEEPKRSRVDELVCGRFSGQAWVEALSRRASVKVNGNAPVETRRFDAVCDDLKVVLVHTASAARPLYLMALLVAHVVRYDYRLSGPRRTARSLKESCYEETSGVFGSTWPPLLTRLLSVSQKTRTTIDGYFAYALKDSREKVLSRKWMTRADALTTAKMLVNVSMLRFPDGSHSEPCAWNSDGNGSLVLTPSDFVRNKVALQHRGYAGWSNCERISSGRARLLHLLRGTAMVFERTTKTLVVPHAYALPPLYYPQLREEYINLAVLVVLMARRILGFTYTSRRTNDSGDNSWSQETLVRNRKVHDCYTRRSPTFHGELSDQQFDVASVATDAIELAYSHKVRLDPSPVTLSRQRTSATSALFFRRACLTLCKSANLGDDAYEPDQVTLHAACLLGVAGVPQFYEVFACAKDDRMTRLRQCFED
ncbi:hypothetical protein HPB50_010121 [Hyalomma asiaticum]|uniref:Uncharacterized protein n=1 Tax=Hyalomma asiaticum TaxID=266040 RepID=A0ACB7RNL8_HYAAI|nr:hypothetical protein HPB50_010121 [Hyalomma asiaticum]